MQKTNVRQTCSVTGVSSSSPILTAYVKVARSYNIDELSSFCKGYGFEHSVANVSIEFKSEGVVVHFFDVVMDEYNEFFMSYENFNSKVMSYLTTKTTTVT